MTDALNPTVPAGWYPDPWGSPSQRWWNGTAWTESVQPVPQPEAPVAVPASAPETFDDYAPVAVRSTYQPVESYRTAAAPQSHYPSRRALRALAQEPDTDEVPIAQEAPVAEEPPAPESELSSPEPQAMPQEHSTPVTPPQAELSFPHPVEPATTPAMTFTPEPAAEGDDGWAASLARWDDIDPTAEPPDPTPIFGDAPPVSYSQRAMRYQPLHGRTSPIWMIVFMPILHAAAVLGSTFLFPDAFPRTDGALVSFVTGLLALRDWMLFAALPLAVAFFLFTLIMGFQDRTRLRLLGHDETASPWWIVLHPLVYLIVRSVRVRQSTGRRGSGPLTTYVCLYIAPALALGVTIAVVSALDGAIPA